MAPKAKAKAKTARPQATTAAPNAQAQPTSSRTSVSEALLVSLALLAIAAVSSRVSQLNLAPVYGSIPSAIYHQKATAFVAILAYITKRALKTQGRDPLSCRDWIAPVALWTPTIQFLLFQRSTLLGAQLGPVVTEALTVYPALLLSFVTIYTLLENLDLRRFSISRPDGPVAVVSYAIFSQIEEQTKHYLPQIIGKSDFLSRAGLQLLVGTLSSFLSRSNLLFLGFPAVLHTLMSNPHYQGVSTTKIANATLTESRFRILKRHDSVTGYLSVLESKKDNFIALRCDHSLLGGEWLVTPERIQRGQKQRETIYSVFTMLEAIRLVKTNEYKPDDEKDALFIGLGIGTSPKAFIAHGINTTIVELDPLVHHYATKYFNLSSNHKAVLQDAVPWVEKTAAEQPEIYDYIIHDVFTGGAEPTPLFTLEFIQGLDRLLKPDGVIAINYAADITLPPARIVLDTIHAVFPSCRIYRDTLPDEAAETFLNMIVFCTKSLNPIEFRSPLNEDYLDSLARREFIPPDEAYEIKLAEIGGGARKYGKVEVLKRGEEDKIEKYHNEAALRHWRIMRTVLPDKVWETW